MNTRQTLARPTSRRERTFHRLATAAVLLLFCALPIAAAEKPSLIVVISVDQMRPDYLDRFRPYFGPDGFNRFLKSGAVFPQARYRHTITFTGPGHASIGSGLDPRHHGIVGNIWYDTERNQPVYCVEDRRTEWVGAPSEPRKVPWAPASPVHLNGDSLGDRLKEKFPRSRVVAVALKDRSAVLMAGRKADAAIWFEERFARFVTSTYYPPHPELLAFNGRVPAFLEARRLWEPSGRIPPADLDRITFEPPELLGAKNPPDGYGRAFPHTLKGPRPVVSSPFGDELVLDLARFVVEQLSLGESADSPDLLFIGLSATDYYGHWFGPDSKEIADGIVRLDSTLASFFTWLDRRVTRQRSLIFLTADHGVQPLPEVTRARHRLATGRDDPSIAGRLDLDQGPGAHPSVSQGAAHRVALERHLARKFRYSLREDAPNASEGTILFFEEPTLYLNNAVLARRGLPAERVKEETREFVRGLTGVLTAFTDTEIANGLPATAPHALAVERSFRADRSGDVFVLLKPGWMWSYGKEAGTTHGQPVDDDLRVPLLAWSAGIAAGSWDARVSPLDIARTVAALYGFEAGEPDTAVLEPVLGRPMGVKKVASLP